MLKTTAILTGCFAASLCLQFAQQGQAQTLLPTLQSITCTTATILVPSSISVDIYDGITQVGTTVAVTGGTSPTTIQLGSLPTTGPYHVLSFQIDGSSPAQELAGSPQSMTCGSPATYAYTSSYTFPPSFPAPPYSPWVRNGGYVTSSGVLSTQSNYSPFSLIYNASFPNPLNSTEYSNEYEINSTLQLNGQSGGSYFHYLAAQTASVQGASGAATVSAKYYAVELANPTFDSGGNCTATLNFWQNTGSKQATLVSSVAVPCSSTTSMRTATFYLKGSGIWKVWALINNYLYSFSVTPPVGSTQYPLGDITAVYPGIGGNLLPSGSGFSQVEFGPRSLIGATPVAANTVATAVFPNEVDLSWNPPTDGSGVGSVGNFVDRITSGTNDDNSSGAYLGSTYADTVAIQPNTTYGYELQERSFHGIYSSQTDFNVVTPSPSGIDPRRTGVRPTGSYWGAMGEQVDVLSGNLSVGLPLLNAQSRNGKSLPFRLAYNSQNWRQDLDAQYTSDFTWNLGQDTGYGYGWTLQLGSLTPYYKNASNIPDHYLYIDSTGAEYRLNVVVNNIYSSQEGVYVWFDRVANLLHFKDGSTWLMGCVSGGLEVDLGTLYPTEITDTNGNQVLIRYMTGYDAIFSNSSGRISEIEDVRAVYNSGTNTRRTYYFTYSQLSGDPIAMHLTGIANTIGTNETYTFQFNGNANPTPYTLADPFQSNPAYGTFYALTQMSMPNSSLSYAMAYDTTGTTGSGALTGVKFPFGGTLTWGYSLFSYINPYLYQMEVKTRTMNDGYSTAAYSFAPSGNNQVHNQVVLSDPHGDSETWTFNTGLTAGPASVGLLSGTTTTSAGGGTPASTSVSWTNYATQSGNNSANYEDPYASSIATTKYGASASETIVADMYGNPTAVTVYNYGNSTAAREYTYEYANTISTTYDAAYLRNLPVSQSIIQNGSTITPSTETYDTTSLTTFGVAPNEYKPSFNTSPSQQTRGNLTQAVGWGLTTNYTYNAAGTKLSASNGTATVNSAVSSATNYAAPDLVNLGGNANLQTSFAYTPFLGTQTTTDNGNGGVGSYTYDTAARVKTATSVDGAVTTYTYATAAPFTQTATVTTSNNAQGRYTTTTFDGFGRARSVVRTDANGVKQSEVDTTYGPGSNAPLGLKTSGTLPYKPGATVYTTATAYDGSGNPTRQTRADGSATTYFYSGNNTTTSDPAGNWKTVTTDVFGNVTALTEPDPNNPAAAYQTSYTYDWVNHLTAVSMGIRDGQTQKPCGGYARTFTYNSSTLQLTSKCEPETGTTNFTYNADGTVHTKTVVNGNSLTYNYDTYGRYTGFSGSSGDSETVGWDTIPLSGIAYGTNAFGRVAYRQQNSCLGLSSLSCLEAYSYTQSGHVTGEELTAYNGSAGPTTPTMAASFTYDNEGRTTGVTYPGYTGNSPASYTYTFDAIGRPSGMSSVASGGVYNAADQLTSLTYLGGTETRSYNSLNQLTGVQLGSQTNLSYYYNAGTDNGQIAALVDTAHGQTVEYSYDSLKRLSAAYYTTLSLLDPGLEQTTVNGWTISGDASWTDLQSRSWPYSMQLTGGTATTSGTCLANASYTASGYYMTSAGATATVTTVGSATQTNPLPSAGSWTAFSFAFTGPSSCAGGVPITLGGGQPGSPVYFDDISLTSPSVNSGANEISNPGFTNLTIAWPVYGNGPLLTQTHAHSGTTSLLTPATAYLGQTITGLQHNYSYTVSAYLSNGKGTLTAGSQSTTVTAGSGWTEINVTAVSSATGTLAITATNTGSSGNVYWDDFSINGSGTPGGQQFGYDGFGNLLSQNPIFGSAPMFNLTVNPNTNQVTSAGATYDAAGNLTYDGTSHYTFDEMNRMTSASTPQGTFSYSYSPGENKRMVVYGSSSSPQTLKMYLYAPNGKLLSELDMQMNSPNVWSVANNGLTNHLYLGGKSVSFPEDRIGSNATGTYWPYGSGNTNPSTGSGYFGTYPTDVSGFYYADQRYYDYNWGRFTSADPSSMSERAAFSQSWNRYAYVLGDPINKSDVTGQFTSAQYCINNPDACEAEDGMGSIFAQVPNLGSGGMDSCEATAFESLPESRAEEICAYEDQSPPPQPDAPICSISLYNRATPFAASPGNHSYLYTIGPGQDPADGTVLEGAPTLHPKSLRGLLFGNWGNLYGDINSFDFWLPGDNPALNTFDGSISGPDVCAEIVALDSMISGYDGDAFLNVNYRPIPTAGYYNSNSFTYTLLNALGLSAAFSPAGWSPGWGKLVPGL